MNAADVADRTESYTVDVRVEVRMMIGLRGLVAGSKFSETLIFVEVEVEETVGEVVGFVPCVAVVVVGVVVVVVTIGGTVVVVRAWGTIRIFETEKSRPPPADLDQYSYGLGPPEVGGVRSDCETKNGPI